MLVRKDKIGNLIKKEREKERKQCEKEFSAKLQNTRKILEEKHQETVKKLKDRYENLLSEKDLEIQSLNKEINRNYSIYQTIRKREKHLDYLTSEVEDEIEKMVIKVQETLQPFYRTRAKVEAVKRNSNKKDKKVQNIFVANNR